MFYFNKMKEDKKLGQKSESGNEKLHLSGVMQRSFLLAEVRKIQQSYKEMGIYCYELYTLMYGIALKKNISYGMDIHTELMNVA